MEAFLISLSTVTIAEMGDRTQLLTLVLAAHYRRPWPIVAGVLCATLASNVVASVVGSHFGRQLTPFGLDVAVGLSLLGMALWTLRPDRSDEAGGQPRRASAFVATCIAFFIAEIGDKTQLATVALSAAYQNFAAVVSGTTLGMLAANVPIVFLGHAFSSRLPLRAIRVGTSLLFLSLGAVFVWRAFQHRH